jgi:hypothetical protein
MDGDRPTRRTAADVRSAAYGEGVSVLVWLAIPLVALVAAVLWASWAARPRGPADPLDSVAAHHRFVEALERSTRGEPPEPDR